MKYAIEAVVLLPAQIITALILLSNDVPIWISAPSLVIFVNMSILMFHVSRRFGQDA